MKTSDIAREQQVLEELALARGLTLVTFAKAGVSLFLWGVSVFVLVDQHGWSRWILRVAAARNRTDPETL